MSSSPPESRWSRRSATASACRARGASTGPWTWRMAWARRRRPRAHVPRLEQPCPQRGAGASIAAARRRNGRDSRGISARRRRAAAAASRIDVSRQRPRRAGEGARQHLFEAFQGVGAQGRHGPRPRRCRTSWCRPMAARSRSSKTDGGATFRVEHPRRGRGAGARPAAPRLELNGYSTFSTSDGLPTALPSFSAVLVYSVAVLGDLGDPA